MWSFGMRSSVPWQTTAVLRRPTLYYRAARRSITRTTLIVRRRISAGWYVRRALTVTLEPTKLPKSDFDVQVRSKLTFLESMSFLLRKVSPPPPFRHPACALSGCPQIRQGRLGGRQGNRLTSSPRGLYSTAGSAVLSFQILKSNRQSKPGSPCRVQIRKTSFGCRVPRSGQD